VAVASAEPYAGLHPQTDNHANTSPLSFLQAGCPSCRPTNSVKALKAKALKVTDITMTKIWTGKINMPKSLMPIPFSVPLPGDKNEHPASKNLLQ